MVAYIACHERVNYLSFGGVECYDDFLVKYGCGVSRIEWGELRIEISEVVSANTRAWPWAWEVWLLCLPLDHYDTLS